jgi:predicted nucleotidyltransferase
MTQSELLMKLANVKHELKQQFGIEEIALFGSYARDEANEESDIDIAILKMNLKDAFAIIDAREYLINILERKVDIGTFKSMKTFIKNRIKKDFVYV